MDIRDFLKPDASTTADLLEGAQAIKNILDAHLQVGFNRREAMDILKTMLHAHISGSVESAAMTQFLERQARGEFDGDN